MLKNYIKIAVRNFERNKAYAFINVMGLALGIACAILIFSLVKYHSNFDTFHSNSDRIYRIVTEQHRDDISYVASVPPPLGKFFRNDFTYAEKVARIVTSSDMLITVQTKEGVAKFKEEASFAEAGYFDIFNYPLLKGNKKTVLSEPNTAIITEKIAKKYFGSENPVNKTFSVDNKVEVRITGVLKDLPKNTDQTSGIYISYLTLKNYNEWMANDSSWGGIQSNLQCYALLRPNVKPEQAEAALQLYVKKYRPESKNVHHYKLQRLDDIHFNARYNGAIEKKNLWILSLIGLFLIVSACLNFINLATAQALKRSKEVGIRKVLGGKRTQLFWQFIAETGLITFVAVGIALVLSYFVLPSFNQLFKSSISINPVIDWQLTLFILVLSLVVVLLSGSYPGLILSGFKPIQALKNKILQKSVSGFNTRRSLIITQFTISQVLIIGTIVIMMQMNYATKSDLGFTKDAIVLLPVASAPEQARVVKEQLLQLPGVKNVALCFAPPASRNYWQSTPRFDDRTEEEAFRITMRPADDDYLKTFDLKLVTGRNLLKSDSTKEFLVNETFARKVHMSNEQVLGKNLSVNGDQRGQIVGVIRDFHDQSFHEDINAVCISTFSERYNNYAVKIDMNKAAATLAALNKTWSKNHPDQIYEYEFLDDTIASFYESESLILKLVQVFSMIAIFIGCLGLYGLVSFMTALKTKEIGIRKVLGGDIGHIIWMFGREFSMLIGIAFLIAAPIGWWLMNQWLQDFEYKISINAWVFIMAIMVTVVISLVTVGYQSLKASLANPVKSLRSE